MTLHRWLPFSHKTLYPHLRIQVGNELPPEFNTYLFYDEKETRKGKLLKDEYEEGVASIARRLDSGMEQRKHVLAEDCFLRVQTSPCNMSIPDKSTQ